MLLTLRAQYSAGVTPRAAADAVISALTPAAWYRNATDVVSSGGFASIWADYASSDKGLVLPGVAGNRATAPDAAPLDLTGDLTLVEKVSFLALPNNTTALPQKNISGAGQFSWAARATVSGGNLTLNFRSSADGTNWAVNATSNTIINPLVVGVDVWFKIVHDVDNGAGGNDVLFYYSTDGASWTQVGLTITTAGVHSRFVSTSALTVGEAHSSMYSPAAATIFRAIVKDGIDGTTVFDADFSSQAIGAGSFTESSSNAATVTINASGAAPAHIGKARDLLQGTGTNQPAYAAGVFTFDGADNFMKVDFTMNQPFTIALRVTPVTWTSGDRIFDGAAANNNYVYQNTATPQISQRGSALGATSAAGTPSLSAKHSLIFVYNGASGVMNIDGTEQTSNAGTNNATGWTLGCNGGRIGTEASNIAVYEAIIFTAALDVTQRASLKTALDLI